MLSVPYGDRIDGRTGLERFAVTVEAATGQSQSVAPADVQPFRQRGGDGGEYRLSVCRRFKAARLARRAEAQIHRKRLHVVA